MISNEKKTTSSLETTSIIHSCTHTHAHTLHLLPGNLKQSASLFSWLTTPLRASLPAKPPSEEGLCSLLGLGAGSETEIICPFPNTSDEPSLHLLPPSATKLFYLFFFFQYSLSLVYAHKSDKMHVDSYGFRRRCTKNLAAMIVLIGFAQYLGYQCPYYQYSFNAKVSPFLSHIPSSIQSEKEELKGSKMEMRIRIHSHESHRTLCIWLKL